MKSSTTVSCISYLHQKNRLI